MWFVASRCATVQFTGGSRAETGEPVETPRGSAEASDSFISGYGQIQTNTVNVDLIKEKAALLKMKGKCVVNEKRLLQLFSCKCPSCGSKLKTEKVTDGVLVILSQQCLQCGYRNQWKSQAAPAGNTHSSTMGAPEIVTVIDQGSASEGETEVSSDQGNMDSDEEWKAVKVVFPARVLQKEPDEETEDDDDEGEEEDDLLSHTPKNSQLCTECGMFYSRRWPHTCIHKIKPYSCNICGKRCVSEMALISHSRIHDENYEFRCKYCYVTFKTKVDKITHEQIHITEGKPYKCPDCLETFPTNKERKIHLEDHTGPKQLKCHICGMEFLWPLSLQRHLVVHTGVKPFKCLVCQRGFKQAGHLKSHMRLHTGERPYKCQHCDKCFTHKVSLKGHIQRYHTSSSGHELKKEKTNEGASDTGESQNGNKRGADSGLDNVEVDQDTEEEVEKGGICTPRKKRRSTGRPIGRPKSFASSNLVLAIQVEDPGTHTTSGKFQVQKLKRAQCSDEGSVDEPTDSEFTMDSAEEEEEKSKKALKNTARSGGRPKNSDSDSDFAPEDSKRPSRQKGNTKEDQEKMQWCGKVLK
ncbi:zinc finger protein 662-like isoform X2 [Mastacembelus armatus]|uniref:zinc finger protein 662-like isoform X2 n=1 Tax=Mastacembelus armatus TaxID=205130 RepID=UPI000E462C98|nr:zinc finger protein 662-like isoform X2 [Mastacembelus armatus]